MAKASAKTKATVTLREAAEQIGIHYTSLSRRRAIDPAFLPGVRRGDNRLFFTPDAVRSAAKAVAAHREAVKRGVRRKQAATQEG